MCAAHFFDVTRSCLGMIDIKYKAILLLSVNNFYLGALQAGGGGWGGGGCSCFTLSFCLFIAELNYINYVLCVSGHSACRSCLF